MNEQLLNIIRQVKDKWGQETVAAIIAEIDRYPIKWNGTLRRSISYEQSEGLDGDVSIFMADYGKFIDEGTGTFGPRNQRIPLQSIPKIAYHLKQWATSKNLNPYAVATNIVKRGGVKPRPFFTSVVEKRVNDLGLDIEKAIVQYMENQINNQQTT